MLDQEKEYDKYGDGLDIGDIENGINPGSHNVNGIRKSRTLVA